MLLTMRKKKIDKENLVKVYTVKVDPATTNETSTKNLISIKRQKKNQLDCDVTQNRSPSDSVARAGILLAGWRTCTRCCSGRMSTDR